MFHCDLCSIYSATHARGEIGPGFHASVAEQFTHFGTVQTDGVEIPNDAGQKLDSSFTQMVAGYNFTERLGLQLNVPVIHRSFQRVEDSEIERGSESGIGDVALVGTFQAYRHTTKKSTFAWSLLGGIKWPTGSTRRLEEELHEMDAPEPPATALESGVHGHDLTLGSGSVDGVIGSGIFARQKRVFLSANVQYAIRTTGDFDYRFADDLSWAGGPGFYLAFKGGYTVALQAVVSGEHKDRDTFRGAKAEDTGVTSVFIGPQLNFTWSDQLSVEAGVDLPVSRENTARQIVPDYRIRAGVTWRF